LLTRLIIFVGAEIYIGSIEAGHLARLEMEIDR
jgi:hypothetical protein